MNDTNLFIGNFSWNLSENDLREIFAPYGELERVELIVDKFSGTSKGFGFVKFKYEEDAERALKELNGKEVDGREIVVNVSRAREPRDY